MTRTQFSKKIYDSVGNALYATAQMGDTTGGFQLGVGKFNYNGSSWDRERNNTQGTLLANALRTSITTSPITTNYNGKGIYIFLNINSASGTGGLQVALQVVDPVSGNISSVTNYSTAETTAGEKIYLYYPGVGVAAGAQLKGVNSMPLPRNFVVTINHVDSSNYTYSVGYSLIN